MNCRRASGLMDRALDQGIGANAPPELLGHLEACARCRAEWDILLRGDAALRAPGVAPAPADLYASFQERVRLRPRPVAFAWPVWIGPVGTLAAAGAAAAIVISFNLRPDVRPAGETLKDSKLVPTGLPTAAGRSSVVEFGRAPADPSASKATSGPEGVPRPVRTPPGRPDVAMRDAYSPVGPPSTPARRADSAAAVEVRASPETTDLSAKVRPALAPGITAAPAVGGSSPSRATGTVEGIGPRGELADRLAGAAGSRPGGGGGAAAGLGGFGGGASMQYRPGQNPAPLGQMRLAKKNPSGDAGNSQMGVEALGLRYKEQLSLLNSQDGLLDDVSPALVTAMSRTVTLRQSQDNLDAALRRLAEQADVPVVAPPAAASFAVMVDYESQPVWMALEDLARQAELTIYPVDNQLVLREIVRPAQGPRGAPGQVAAPVFRAAVPAPASARQSLERQSEMARRQMETREPRASAPASAPRVKALEASPLPAKPVRQGTRTSSLGAVPAGLMVKTPGPRKPDRKIWAPAWGRYLDLGFTSLSPQAAEGPPRR